MLIGFMPRVVGRVRKNLLIIRVIWWRLKRDYFIYCQFLSKVRVTQKAITLYRVLPHKDYKQCTNYIQVAARPKEQLLGTSGYENKTHKLLMSSKKLLKHQQG